MTGDNRRRQSGTGRLTIEQAQEIATRLDAGQELIDAAAEEQALQASVEAHFRHLGAGEVLRLWQSGRNEQGRKLTQFEGMALMERWALLTGTLLPDMNNGTSAASATPATPAIPPTPEPADDTMLRVGEVMRLTSLSLSTLKRYVADGLFPKPVKLSPRRNGWLAGEVRAWRDQRTAERDQPPARVHHQHRGRLH